ncbi:hypothetical protein [Variovorax saccharolyticus]|uniref:hypothetical protein n=1 Tax=Variovorax saccharolyticus TaxID=3053516 RepID=UPI0025787C68|nr:hypothetical protein [Variovorax sp. J31P216]MDM0027400.1 hypothetical protein [Variovorax sp. J31P216]
MSMRRLFPAFMAALATACFAWAPPAAAQSGAAALRASYEKLAPSLASSPFGRPMVLTSAETQQSLKGEVYGVLDRPLAKVSAALDKPASWCEMMMLHLNNRACRIDAGQKTLTLSVVRKYDIPVEEAFELSFRGRLVSATPDYFEARLNSGKGPFGTSNYRIALEGIPLENGKSFIHFSYAYDQSSATRVASKGYLATFGRGKVGFTAVGKEPSGEPRLVGGMLGLVERNAMRYFLAVDAYTQAPDDFDKRLVLWYSGTEKYPRQLNDLSQAEYLKLKQSDRQRQGTQRP